MGRESNRLSAIKVSKLSKPGRYADGAGLYLQVSEAGTKSWLFRYMLHGRARNMGLGALHTVTLAEARESARRARQRLLDGTDPLEHRNGERASAMAEKARRVTFKDAADRYLRAHRPGWKNEKHADQWLSTLETYAYPVIGGLAVSSIDTTHILQILEPIWAVKTETATRVRGRIELILDWATARGHRVGENPARWRGHLDKLLPAKSKVAKVRHHPAMAYAHVPAFVADLRENKSISALALELTILCATRTNEVIGVRRDSGEVDLKSKVWTVPGERTKSGREHRIPLSARAIEIFKSAPEIIGNPYYFVGGHHNQHLSNMAMLELLRGMRGPALTVHGFRSSFRDWAGEQTNSPREIAEAALAHVLKDKTEAAYRRGDALEKRRKLMDAWAAYCARRPATGNVLPLKFASKI